MERDTEFESVFLEWRSRVIPIYESRENGLVAPARTEMRAFDPARSKDEWITIILRPIKLIFRIADTVFFAMPYAWPNIVHSGIHDLCKKLSSHELLAYSVVVSIVPPIFLRGTFHI
jgi:hypothetical protein